MTNCAHTITRGRAGEKGTWCDACGAQDLAVHDQPCQQCRHHKRYGPGGFGGHSSCLKLLMAVTPDLHVSYHLEPSIGRPGLCFEQASEEELANAAAPHRPGLQPL